MLKYKAKGTTLLHTACKNGQVDLVNDLIKNGADVNARTPPGGHPYMTLQAFREI
jgi:ankyrin repeat protein